jgi:5'(3')-deoxyribonucleotidase
MKVYEILNEDGRIVKGVNTTVDVGVGQIPIEAAKFGNSVDKDGKPPTLSKKVKGKSTNVLYNLGLAESKEFVEALGEIANATEIYVDMDGVLADFFGEWAKLMGVEHFTDINKEHDIEDALQKIRDTENFWLDLPLTSNAKNLLNLIKQVKGSYKILSSPLPDDPNSEPHKREWIEKHLGFFPPEDVIITHDKAKYATQEDGTPNILIDDYGVNISKWEAAGGYGFKHKDHKFERTAKSIKQHMKEPVEETIRKQGDKYVVYSKKGKRMGTYTSRKAANKRIQQIEYFKHKG